MISLRKTVSKMDDLEAFKRTALETYALSIGAMGEHAVEVEAELAAHFRSRIQAVRDQVKRDINAQQLVEIQSSVNAELRQYNDQALPLLKRLRSDVKAAARAMEAFAGSFAASSMDLDGEVKRDLQRLDKAARSDDLSEIRDVIRAASSSIASSVERLRESNQLAIVQLKDEIRLLHQELKTGQTPVQAKFPASADQQEALGQIDSLVRQKTPFSLMLLAVKNLVGLRSCYSKAEMEKALSSLQSRLQSALPSGSQSSRWAEAQFLAILTVDPTKAMVLSRDLSKKLSGSYAGQDGASAKVALEVTSGVIDWKAQGDPTLLPRRLEQLSDTLSKL